MDSPTIAKNFKYNSSQQPMFSVTETPLHYRSFSQNKFTFQDISFSSSSSYLNPQDPNPHKNHNTADCTEISIFDAQKYFSNDPKQEPPSDDLSSVPRLSSSVSSIDGYGRNFRTRSFHAAAATPTASSEASWNSQSGLLTNRPGSIRVSLKNVPSDDHQKKKKSLKKSIFGQKCCCTGDKSVQVRELTTPDFENRGPRGIRSHTDPIPKEIRDINQPKVAVSKPPPMLSNSNSIRLLSDPLMFKSESNSVRLVSDTPIMHKSDDNSTDASRQQRVSASGIPFTNGNAGFSFPILSPSSPPTKPEFSEITTKPITSDPPRESLEVFQPKAMTNYTNGRPHFNPGSPIGRVTNMDDDVASDASSDLFEIESFSTQTTAYPMYRRRESIDDAPTFNARRFASGNNRSLDEPTTPSVAGTECYAPSEFSVDWSVTTAEGYDKGSVTNFSVSASEFGGAAFLRRRMDEEEAAARGGDFGKRKGNTGGLSMMGCRQEKAVSVGPQPLKFTTAAVDGPPAMLPLHVGGRPPRAMKPQMGSCNSARLSLAFAA